MIDVSKISVFMYFDYRDFIRAVLETMQSKGLSLRAIQENAGVSGSAFFSRILDGSRPLSVANAKNIAKSWGLPDDESDYFLDLVRFGNEKNVDVREELLRKLLAVRANNQEFALQDSSLKFFSKWYYPVLRDLLPLLPPNMPAEKIGRMFTPVLRAPQVESGIRYLMESGFVTLDENGVYRVEQPIVSTPPRVRSTILRKYHLKNLEVNSEVYDLFTSDDRSVTSVTCSLSKESFEKVREEIAKLREKILALSREEKNPDRVCHVGFQLVNRAKVKEVK
ncbi:TIGR02147 family protein [Fibrobacter sp. UWB13]|uniref:TIGR02147 family protein n=2 Tax=unclassified Fibrobacter TaxID=2634177 RepID=UPI00090EFED5|nr:TIGR02147 family protein [Fibrobacter sp. UWB13]SHM12923.1 TIGR02147 family protein [Fibrobacter sp. UWB7]SMG23087.1 TIGR02147 family protein [Fibrobacter sp. UWB13]